MVPDQACPCAQTCTCGSRGSSRLAPACACTARLPRRRSTRRRRARGHLPRLRDLHLGGRSAVQGVMRDGGARRRGLRARWESRAAPRAIDVAQLPPTGATSAACFRAVQHGLPGLLLALISRETPIRAARRRRRHHARADTPALATLAAPSTRWCEPAGCVAIGAARRPVDRERRPPAKATSWRSRDVFSASAGRRGLETDDPISDRPRPLTSRPPCRPASSR